MSSTALRDRLGYAFAQPALLTQALTHRSYGAHHNERLEFVGDAVLGCVIAHALYRRFSKVPEGDLSRARAALVNRDTLARVALALGIGRELKLGEGAVKTGGAEQPSILADALEAVFGAVFVDGGFDAATRVVESVYADELAAIDPSARRKDAKTQLQEVLQAQRVAVPEYGVVGVTGEAHAQTIRVECRIPALDVSTLGEGPSRRVAEQKAAAAALDLVSPGHD